MRIPSPNARAASACRTVRLASMGIAAALTAFAAARPARADMCVELDTTRDNLAEADRSATKPLLERAFEKNGRRVATTGCTETYRAYHVKLGQSITVVVSGPEGSRELRVSSIEELPDAYGQVVTALLTRQPVGSEGTAMDRTNVTSNQVSPNRVMADSLFYVRLGYGAILGSEGSSGPDFGFGVRRELDRLAIDLSFLNLTLGKEGDTYKDVTGSFIKLMGLYYFDPYANHSLYAGAGLGWGVSTVYKDGALLTNSGLNAELAIGYEMLRVSNIRMLVQLNGTLPTYSATGYVSSNTLVNGVYTYQSQKESVYAPTIGLSIGLGFGRSNTIIVR